MNAKSQILDVNDPPITNMYAVSYDAGGLRRKKRRSAERLSEGGYLAERDYSRVSTACRTAVRPE